MTPLLLVFGKTMMSRKVFYANSSVVLAKNFPRVVEVDSEVKSIFSSVVTHLQLNLNYFNMFIKLLLEVFTLQVKVALQLV